MAFLERLFWKVSEYAGVAAVVIIWFTLVVSMHAAGYSGFDKQPLSDLALTTVGQFYSIGLLLGGAAMLFFFAHLNRWFKPNLAFETTFAIAIACQFIIALIPDMSHGKPSIIHWTAGGILAVTILILLKLFTFTKGLAQPIRQWTNLAFWSIIIFIVPEIWLVVNHITYDFAEFLNVSVFNTWILYINVVTHRAKLANV